jgi:hypothetical protein
MQTIIDIIDRARGWRSDLYLRIENPPYIALIVEALQERGPLGLPAISVAHYTDEFGELMRHPEMRFELKTGHEGESNLVPFYWRNDFVAVEQYSRFTKENEYIHLPNLYERHVRFAAEWNEVLSRQNVTRVFAEHWERA